MAVSVGLHGSLENAEIDLQRTLTSLLQAAAEPAASSERQAACALVVGLAERAPTLLILHLQEVVERLWVAVRDGKPETRDAARRAVRACLGVVGQRDGQLRVRWHEAIFEEALIGLGVRGNEARNGDAAHGSLLVLIELIDTAMLCWLSCPTQLNDLHT